MTCSCPLFFGLSIGMMANELGFSVTTDEKAVGDEML
jgi:D-serine dehydratase